MAYPPITTLPAAPNRNDPDNFSTEADAFVAALPALVTETNAAGVYTADQATAAAADAATAAVAETAAVGAANFAGAWSGLTGALNIPASVSHSDEVWILTVNLADVTSSEPVSGNSDWISVSSLLFTPVVVLTAAATVDIDLSLGNYFTLTADQNTTFTFSNPPVSGKAFAFTLIFTQPATAITITWPSSVDWAAATTPDAPADAEVNAYGFITDDAGTVYYGFLGGAAFG
jgi:hypothetical protein